MKRILGIICVTFSLTVHAEPNALKFAWFAELYPEHSFWAQHLAFSQAVANDLNVELSTNYAETDQIIYKRLLQEAIDQGVDGLLLINIKKQDQAILSILDGGTVPAISNVLPMDYNIVGQPREKYADWIGEVLVDEVKSGYDLANLLIAEARKKNLLGKDGKLHMVAIAGNQSDGVGIRRNEGLMKAVAEHSDLILHQMFYEPNWSRVGGERFTIASLKRYPETSIIWSANDDISLGVIEGVKKSKLVPGKDVLTGGIDGTIDVIEKVATGEAVCTVSGLFMHGGWVTILLHDYLNGIDFESDTGVIINVDNTVIDINYAQAYLDKFADGNWDKIDFKKLSKVHNPNLKTYEFSVGILLEQ